MTHTCQAITTPARGAHRCRNAHFADGWCQAPDWECVAWKATGGYANRNAANQNARRERIWFSPACIKPEAELF